MNLDNFWIKVNKTNACWNWTGAVRGGYGAFRVDNKIKLAHRVSYTIHFGTIHEIQLVCHSCDNHLCVNPDHLFLGDHQDNFEDMVNKGRGSSLFVGRKLSDQEVKNLKIRLISKDFQDLKSLSKEINIPYSIVKRINRNEYYKNVII